MAQVKKQKATALKDKMAQVKKQKAAALKEKMAQVKKQKAELKDEKEEKMAQVKKQKAAALKEKMAQVKTQKAELKDKKAEAQRARNALKNLNVMCHEWAKRGQCRKNPKYMLKECPRSCYLQPSPTAVPTPQTTYS